MAEDEIETLEKGLLSPETSKNGYGNGDGDGDGDDDSSVIYTASFEESEENLVKYETVQWILYSLLFLLAWGAGLLMLLYLPVRRFVLRKDVRSRKLYVTRNAIVYKVTRPVALPCFGVLKKEKHVLLPSVADIVIEQGYLQSFFGVYSVRIENAGVRRPASDDLQIQGITNPNAFRKAVLSHLSNLRSEAFSGQVSAIEGAPSLAGVNPRVTAMTPSKPFNYGAIPSNDFEILQKLDEVETSVKRVEKVIEEQRLQAYIQIGQGDS